MAFRRTVTDNSSIRRFYGLKVSDFLPTESEILRAMEHQKTRILRRTERGVDYQERGFAPYSSNGPYYYYPNGPVGKKRTTAEKSRAKGNVSRTAAKLGRKSGAITRSGLGIKFPSYSAFKLTYLGRTSVDLTGPRAPHMLQQIVTAAHAPHEGVIGIYGEAAKRATGHNEGTRHLRQRRFFDSSNKDNEAVTNDIRNAVKERLRKQYGLIDVNEPAA